MGKIIAYWGVFFFAVFFLQQGCSSELPAGAPSSLPAVNSDVPGTPYDKLNHPDAGADGSSDSDIQVADSGGPTDSGDLPVADSGLDADAGTPDVGLKVCPVDIFRSATHAGDLKFGTKAEGELKGDCESVRYSLILAKGQTAHVEAWGDHLTPDLRIYGPGRRGFLMQSIHYAPGVLSAIEITADIPGEYFVLISQAGRRGASGYTVEAACRDKCGLVATRYPIVLSHGFSGFKNIGPIDYYYNVINTFNPQGYDLRMAVVDPYNSVQKRGPQLAAIIDRVLAETYAYKVNIISHSQGGLDSRFVISAMSYYDRVGMLVTLATPHKGTAISDLALNDPAWMNSLKVLFGAVGIIIETEDQEHNLEASLASMSYATMAEFNKNYPPDPRVKYKSWACKSCPTLSSSCKNPVDIYFLPFYNAIYDMVGDNDGVVPTDSAIWEGFQGVLDSDHIDIIGQLMGMTGQLDYMAFYTKLLHDLVAEGW
jgi:triacylglycerol esterase/lipase EstA (alpha/beta hydrolase family)